MISRRLSVIALAFSFYLAAGAGNISQGAEGRSAEVGLITYLRGKVEYQKGSEKEWRRASRFMKVRMGDSFHLSGPGTLRIVYFKDGRIENWAGPSWFRLGREGGKLLQGEEPRISATNVEVSKEIEVAANLLQKSGAWVSRASRPSMTSEEKEKVLAQYKKLKAAAERGDPLPELYLLTILIKRGEYDMAERYIKGALRNDPESPELREIFSFFGGGR